MSVRRLQAHAYRWTEGESESTPAPRSPRAKAASWSSVLALVPCNLGAHALLADALVVQTTHAVVCIAAVLKFLQWTVDSGKADA